MSPSTKIFITGATGFIGGAVVNRLLAHPDAKSFELVALVRSAEKAEKLNAIGIKTVIGSYSDLDLLTRSTKEADVVFTIADSDYVAATEAILKGLKQHHETGKVPILIHTVTLFADDARGQHGGHKVYSDLDSDAIEALPETAPHKNVDVLWINADNEGYVRTYIIAPPTVFGPADGPLVDIGVQHKYSVQIPLYVNAAVQRKRAGYMGAGKNVCSAASVRDTAALFILIFDAVQVGSPTLGHGRDGYYFVENFEYSVYEATEEIGKVLVELGIIDSTEPTQFTQEEVVKYIGDWWGIFASNSRVKADRSRALGWKPVDGKKEFITSIREDVLAVVDSLEKK